MPHATKRWLVSCIRLFEAMDRAMSAGRYRRLLTTKKEGHLVHDAATRTNECRSTEPVLLLAFELGLETWKVGFVGDGSHPPRLREIPGGDTRALLREIARAKRELGLPAKAPVVSCYEAGRDGFWLHRFLTHHGIGSHVVDSASIEVNRRARRAKSDRIDLRALLRLLRPFVSAERDVWSVVRVPTVTDEDARSLHRELRTLVKERTRSTNRIRGLLMNHGVRLASLGKDFPGWLERARQWDGSPLPPGVRRRLATSTPARARRAADPRTGGRAPARLAGGAGPCPRPGTPAPAAARHRRRQRLAVRARVLRLAALPQSPTSGALAGLAPPRTRAATCTATRGSARPATATCGASPSRSPGADSATNPRVH